MAEKLLNTRIALRIDTFENWAKTDDASKGANLVLKRGEIGLCEIPAQNPEAQTAPTVLFKVGDGTKKFSELNWASALAADVYSWAKASDVILDGQVIKFKNGSEVVKTIDLTSFIAGAKKYADEKAAAVQGNLNTLSGTVSTLSETVTNNNNAITQKVSTVESQYKAADTALEKAISDEETARKNADTALQTEINNIKTNIASGLHFRGIVAALSDVADPAEGDIAIVGTVEYIYDGSKWQEFGDAEAHAAKTYVDTELAKKVDKTVYDAAIKNLQAEDTDIRSDFAAADTELKTELEGKINLKADTSALNTAVGRIEAAEDAIEDLESTKLDASTYNTFVQNTYTTDKAALAADIKEVDDRLNDKGDIKVALDAAKAQADKGVADAATAQSGVNGITALVGNGFSSTSTIAQQLAAVKQTADAAAVASIVNAAITALQDKDTAHETRMGKIESAATALAGRVTTAEGNITRIDGEIDGHDTKIAALEGKVDVAKVSTAISEAVAAEAKTRSAADTELSDRIDAYDARFGTADDLLVLNCGTSTTNI